VTPRSPAKRRRDPPEPPPHQLRDVGWLQLPMYAHMWSQGHPTVQELHARIQAAYGLQVRRGWP
jgi:hypothetical protein